MQNRTKELGELLRVAGYKMSAKLMHDGFDGRDGQAVWEVTFSRGCSFTFTYHNAVVARYFPQGRPMDFHHLGVITVDQLRANKTTKPMKPTYSNAMYHILSGAQSVCSDKSFENSCDDFGYSKDSRNALAAYKNCLQQGQGLDRLGCDHDELNRLFEDY